MIHHATHEWRQKPKNLNTIGLYRDCTGEELIRGIFTEYDALVDWATVDCPECLALEQARTTVHRIKAKFIGIDVEIHHFNDALAHKS